MSEIQETDRIDFLLPFLHDLVLDEIEVSESMVHIRARSEEKS